MTLRNRGEDIEWGTGNALMRMGELSAFEFGINWGKDIEWGNAQEMKWTTAGELEISRGDLGMSWGVDTTRNLDGDGCLDFVWYELGQGYHMGLRKRSVERDLLWVGQQNSHHCTYA